MATKGYTSPIFLFSILSQQQQFLQFSPTISLISVCYSPCLPQATVVRQSQCGSPTPFLTQCSPPLPGLGTNGDIFIQQTFHHNTATFPNIRKKLGNLGTLLINDCWCQNYQIYKNFEAKEDFLQAPFIVSSVPVLLFPLSSQLIKY